MILLADSGSTKTDWRLIINNTIIHQYTSQGINPYFLSVEQIVDLLGAELLPQIKTEIPQTSFDIIFYGAGCEAETKKMLIKTALFKLFPQANITVHSDLLGACHALCGNTSGLVAILGTGSNTCFYDGNKIVRNIDSLGFFLGDEGSGAHIGKTLVQAFLNKEMPADLSNQFFEQYKMGRDEILDNVYKKPMPSRFLASFTKFAFEHLQTPFIHDLVASSFDALFQKHICKYDNYKQHPLNCVGSVAFYFHAQLKQVADEKGVKLGKVIASPMEGLLHYYLD